MKMYSITIYNIKLLLNTITSIKLKINNDVDQILHNIT